MEPFPAPCLNSEFWVCRRNIFTWMHLPKPSQWLHSDTDLKGCELEEETEIPC